jgi:hypothetical protein
MPAWVTLCGWLRFPCADWYLLTGFGGHLTFRSRVTAGVNHQPFELCPCLAPLGQRAKDSLQRRDAASDDRRQSPAQLPARYAPQTAA